jgi:hypothetical protein
MSRPEYVWRFDINRRRYAPNGKGGPIWREHWKRERIVDETARSYITEHGDRVRKTPDDCTHVFDENRLAVLVWAHANRPELSRWVLHQATVDQLQQVSAIMEGK